MKRVPAESLARLAGLDRRWLYLVLSLALLAAMLMRLQFPDQPSVLVMPLYERIESLSQGAPILISFEYTPSSAPELEPMAYALTRHALLKGHRLCFVSLWSEGNNLIGRVISDVIHRDFPAKVEGVHWVNLGYKAGGEMLINAMRQDIASMYLADVSGHPLAETPALAGVSALGDFALIIGLSAGAPGLKEWILFGGDPTGVPVAGGCAGAGTAEFLPYFPHQLIGLLGGLKGAAEYETALQRGHPEFTQQTQRARQSMGPQAVGHTVIVLFIVLGNLGAFFARRRQGEPGAATEETG